MEEHSIYKTIQILRNKVRIINFVTHHLYSISTRRQFSFSHSPSIIILLLSYCRFMAAGCLEAEYCEAKQNIVRPIGCIFLRRSSTVFHVAHNPDTCAFISIKWINFYIKNHYDCVYILDPGYELIICHIGIFVFSYRIETFILFITQPEYHPIIY